MVDPIMTSPDTPDSMFRSVGDAEVSLDEMLSLACRQGKQDIVELLLESGAKVNYRNKAGNTPLLEACSQGHMNIARLLLDKKADIDAPTETTSDSALTWACTLGNEEIVHLLLEHRAFIEHRTRDGCTALMFAALAGHDRVAKLLLGNYAELNVESDSNKDSPLTFACWKGHIRVVELFLVHGANIEHRTKEGFSPLMFAALGGHTEVARLLLEKRAEVNQPSGSNNDIPLTSACWKGHHDVVELLLCYQSNIEHHTKDGCTPLMLAAREGHLTVAQLLLNHNARVNIPSGSENNIPLTLACWKGHKDVVELLLNYKSNIEHQNKAGCTPLMLAAREGHYEATELLLEHGANLNTPSGSNDDTPLTLACWKGHNDVVNLLLDRQSSINHQTKTGCTPLMEATREGHISVAKMLLEAGADVETPDNYGQTPFFMACWKGHAEVANLLLEYGANKDCKTKTGITPFFQACRENHVEVVKLLLDYGCNPSMPFPNSRECPLTLAAERGFSELTQVLLSRSANVECRTKKGCTPLFLTCKEGFKEIAIMLTKHGAETESSDHRGVTPLLAAFKNGYVEVVDWLLGHVTHLPSDLECQKALMAPRLSDKDILPQRSKCLELIMRAKKAREQAALKNAQILFEELDAEKEKKELRRKAAARKKANRKERKRKRQEKEKVVEPHDDEDEYEEEEEETGINKNNTRNPVPDHAHSDDEETSVQSKNRKNKKNKHPVKSSTQSSSHPVAVVTDTRRTNPQSPGHMAVESWEEEETEDEFVDAPEFPEAKGPMSEKPPGKNGTTPDPSMGGSDASSKRNSSRGPVKSQKGGSEDGGGKGGRKTQRAAQSNNIGQVDPSGGETKGGNKRTPRTRSPPEDPAGGGQYKGRTSSVTKWSNRSDSPLNSSSRLVSSNSGTRGAYVACVDQEEEESCESWSAQVEQPGSDWSNDDKSDTEGFKPQNPSRVKSWASVSSTSSSTNGPAHPTPVVTPGNNPVSSTTKPWHEVSRAITTFQMTVSNSLVGRIIGKKGLKINQIQADSGAQISISRAIPRSIERLITIKGTDRSVKTAQDLIEEALSTPSKDVEATPIDTGDKPGLVPNPRPQSHSTGPVVNPWNQTLPVPQPTTTVWGQKRYSDVVPPTSLMKPSHSHDKENLSIPTRRTSLPIKMQGAESQEPTTDTNTACTTSSSPEPPLILTTPTEDKPAPPIPRHSVTVLGPLSSVNEEEEVGEEGEGPKKKRSLSDPAVLTRPHLSVSSKHPANEVGVYRAVSTSHSTPVVTVSSVGTFNSTPHKELGDPVSEERVRASPQVGVVTPDPVVTKPTTRTVGIVTPTQSVRLFQHDTTPSSTPSTPSPSVTTATTSGDHLSVPSAPSGTFGAIGPPRRSSLPSSTGAHYVEGNSPRKFSYAGMHLNNRSLTMVPESYSMNQMREYPWTHNAPPPPMPHPPMSPINTWNNHGGSMEWPGGMGGLPPHEYEQRMRSQSWAGLGPSGGFPAHHPHSLMDYQGGSHGHLPPPSAPPTHHAQWNKFHSPVSHAPRPPPYLPRPHSGVPNFPPCPNGGGFGYHNNDGFGDARHRQMDPNSAHPSAYPQCRFSSPNSTSQPSINDTSTLSLRQVLGDLEPEIFPGGTPAMDFVKEESPSIAKRWSISSVPPNMPGHDSSYNYHETSSVWTSSGHSLRHSVSSPFRQNSQQNDQPLISDLAASWPIWTTPSSSSSNEFQSVSSFSSGYPPNSCGGNVAGNDEGWASQSSDLADLMKRLGIEEHTPTLQSRGINLGRLLSMSDEERRDLLPMGPRVKLMNAINMQLQGEKLFGSVSEPACTIEKSSSFPGTTGEGSSQEPVPVTTATHKCSPFVQ